MIPGIFLRDTPSKGMACFPDAGIVCFMVWAFGDQSTEIRRRLIPCSLLCHTPPWGKSKPEDLCKMKIPWLKFCAPRIPKSCLGVSNSLLGQVGTTIAPSTLHSHLLQVKWSQGLQNPPLHISTHRLRLGLSVNLPNIVLLKISGVREVRERRERGGKAAGSPASAKGRCRPH